jgi:Na+-transporting methylmalonyl-CoA/oxaloacetate decarboxylase gamma subunit
MPIRIINPENPSINREGAKMMDYRLAFLVSGAGYGIVILVMIILSVLIWVLSLTIKRAEKTR